MKRAETGTSSSLFPLFHRETSQASTGFTPFELLDLAHEAWEEPLRTFCSLVEYIQEMQERINRVVPIIREHMEVVQ